MVAWLKGNYSAEEEETAAWPPQGRGERLQRGAPERVLAQQKNLNRVEKSKSSLSAVGEPGEQSVLGAGWGRRS